MLAKKKASKKAAIAAHRSALPSTVSAASSARRGGSQKNEHGAKEVPSASAAADTHRRSMTRADAQDASAERAKVDLIRTIGDDVNTRLLNIHHSNANGGDNDDIDDAILHEERKYQLMEEARLAAGMQQRIVSSHIEAYYKDQRLMPTSSPTAAPAAAGDAEAEVDEADRLALVRVRHNCNAITAVASLGLDVLVLGDKSGKVYMVDLNPIPDAPSLFASQRAEEQEDRQGGGGGVASSSSPSSPPSRRVDLSAYRRKRKVMLEPALPKAVVSLAISDTRGNRPTTRDLFERTTVDHSCPSYTVAGCEDGSIAVWETLTQKHKGLLFMHRKAVTGLCFRANTANLYSASDDGTVRVWSVPQMLSLDKLFGHEGKIHDLRALKRETCATVGDDGTMRFWKIDAATQQSFTYTIAQREEALAAAAAKGEILLVNGNDGASVAATATQGIGSSSSSGKNSSVSIQLECVAMVNESTVVCGATDGSLVLFDVNKRRPLDVVPVAHGFDSLQDGTGLERTALQMERAREEEAATAVNAAAAAVRALLQGVDDAAPPGGKKVKKAKKTSAPVAPPRPPRVYDRKRIANSISAVAAIPYADVVASASYDGVVRLWQVRGVGGGNAGHGHRTALQQPGDADEAERQHQQQQQQPGLVLLAELPVRALVTSLHFSPDGDCLFAACSKECRRGRWIVCRAAQNGVAVIPLTAGGAKQFLLPSAGGDGGGIGGAAGASVLRIEHVPAQLYDFQGEDSADDGDSDDGVEEEGVPQAQRGSRKRPSPGDDLPIEYLDDDNDDDGADMDMAMMLGDTDTEGRDAKGRAHKNGSGEAFFTVGKDGQLMFSSKASPSSPSPSSSKDVMKRRVQGPTQSSLPAKKRLNAKKAVSEPKGTKKKKPTAVLVASGGGSGSGAVVVSAGKLKKKAKAAKK